MAFSSAFDSELAGAPDPINPKGKYSNYDVGALEAMAPQETAPSPQGAASQGAVGDPASAGKAPASAALEGEAPQDMLTIFNQATPEDRAHMTSKQTDALAPHGKSLEGGLEEVLMNGGPQAMARAAQFGIDLTEFANKINPPKGKGPEAEVGQAFGNVPTPEQSAGGEAFKSQEQAVGDMRGKIAASEDEAAAKKQAQRDAIAAFLMETGLRILASQREDLGGAFGEAALGTMEAGSARKRQSSQDKLQADETARQNRRQDTSDEAAALRAQQQTEKYEYEVTQREAEENRAAQDQLEKVVQSDGTILFANPKEGTLVDEDGVPVRTMTDEQVRKYSREGIDKTASDNAVRRNMAGIRKIVDEDSYMGKDPRMLAIIESEDSTEQQRLIRELAKDRAAVEEDELTTDYETLDY